MAGVLAVGAVVLLLVVLVWYQSTGISTRNRWRGDGRFGQLAPEAPFPRRPIDPDARFSVLPRARIVVPAASAALLVLAAAVLLGFGLEPLAAVALVLAAVEAGAAVGAARHNRVAVEFVAERLRDGR